MLRKDISLENKKVLITGCAGFIGATLITALLKSIINVFIIGIDNLNDYYDVSLKEYRLNEIKKIEKCVSGKFIFIKDSIANKQVVERIFLEFSPQIVINLAAQAGVRYSIQNPYVYIDSNIIGFFNIIEACRHSYDNGKKGVEHFIYASSSSVYGNNNEIPYSISQKTDTPVSLYAATKKTNELFAYSYAKLYGIPMTGLRFFTVYGPAGRPDMAYYKFTQKLLNKEKIKIFNYGNCKRDFTYIDDIVSAIMDIMQCSPLENQEHIKFKIYNIGNNMPVDLLEFVNILQRELKSAGVLPQDYDIDKQIQLIEMQPGDVEVTCADVSELVQDFGFRPSTSLEVGLKKFAQWYKNL